MDRGLRTSASTQSIGQKAIHMRWVRRPKAIAGSVMTPHPASLRTAVNTKDTPMKRSVPRRPSADFERDLRTDVVHQVRRRGLGFSVFRVDELQSCQVDRRSLFRDARLAEWHPGVA